MLVFSTGEVGGDPMPGTDLGSVGFDNDIAGLNLSVRVPDGARSMRVAVRVLAPDPADGPEGVGDLARVLVQGDPIALDPWSLSSLGAVGPALSTARDFELEGTPFAPPAGVGTAWIETAVSVAPGTLLAVRIEVRDGPESAFGDLVLLADGLRFDRGIVEDVQPGTIPWIGGVTPARVPEDAPATILVSGRDLPPDALFEGVTQDGELLFEVADADVRRLSAELVEIDLPPLPEGWVGLRVRWSGGALRWSDLVLVETPIPRLLVMRPDTGPVTGGGLASVEGSGLFNVTSVSVGGQEVTEFVVLSPERMELVVPAGPPGPADVEVFAAGGFAEGVGLYTWSAPQAGSDAAGEEPGPDGPTPISCSMAERKAGVAALLLSPLLARRRARRDGRRPASA